ncbi:GlxA family transcriptional regulator [Tabrizicola sp.]|jgi:transcriptional regulator GlxA family with amidase domain|uniref:GlxA family transcriptional regulator n=1 Tax=Tabrizicola sp. TaxID=2005166 RepID=UPI001A638327|nr:GlxA family transcriptional regulator [Tabrizicola sp.]MBL9072251.1 GlxA family transcriptional regulator [Tabrizicola sp.]
MTENAIFQPSRDPLTIALLVLPQASILEVASALDPLRNANRQLGHEAYRWRVVSPDGAPVPLTCGIELPSSGPLSHAVGAEALIVAAGYRLADVATRPLIHDLRRIAPRFALVGGIDAAPWVLARAGLLDGYRATVHWEDLEDLAASHPHIDVVPDRFVIDRNRVTIAGAAPAADFMLHLIRTRHGAALARQVASSFLATVRKGSEPQIAPEAQEPALDPRVAQALARMEARIDAPEPASDTAKAVGLSPRRLESLFRAALGTTPASHALDLRLQAARRMLTDTRHPLAEVALRTGFSSPSTLSRAFRARFGQPPGALRR